MNDPRFRDGKAADALRTIGEVSDATGIKPHVLRYWEVQFPMLKPLKRSGGRRYYRTGDIALIDTINRLVNGEGYTLKGARQALRSSDPEPRAAASLPVTAGPAGDDLLGHLRAIRATLAHALEA
jgi:DNA-binding transcriptional MerR regulator